MQWRDFDGKAPVLGAAGSADAVLTFRNVHNWVAGGTADAYFLAFFAALKPGGVLGVVDHRAKPGADLDTMKKSGYLTEALVIDLATRAGFVLEARSEVNANPKDDTDHPNGVWTLPPVNRHDAGDDAMYKAIGESDRMTLRFRKPALSLDNTGACVPSRTAFCAIHGAPWMIKCRRAGRAKRPQTRPVLPCRIRIAARGSRQR